MENRSPFNRKGPNAKSYGEISLAESDISFVSSGRPSVDRGYSPYYENLDSGRTTPRISNSTEIDMNRSFEYMQYGRRSVDIASPPEYSSFSQESDRLSTSSQSIVSQSNNIPRVIETRPCLSWQGPIHSE